MAGEARWGTIRDRPHHFAVRKTNLRRITRPVPGCLKIPRAVREIDVQVRGQRLGCGGKTVTVALLRVRAGGTE